jgi:hypothetical protein
VEDGDNRFFSNVGTYLQNYMSPHPERSRSSYSPLLDPQTSLGTVNLFRYFCFTWFIFMSAIINSVTQWLKAAITEREEVGVATQWPVNNDYDVVFSMWSVLRLYNKDQWDKPLSYS